MSANNYVSNQDVRLPTRVKRALNDLVVKYQLEAAQVATGVEVNDEVGNFFKDLLDTLKDKQPRRFEMVRGRMARPMEEYRFDARYSAFRELDLRQAGALGRVDLLAKHKAAVSPLRDSWVHIPPSVPGAGELERPVFDDPLLVFPQAQYRGLRFHLHKVRCIDETGPSWFEWGEDEIYCGAVAVDENGETSSGGLFKVGDFDDGDVKTYSFPGKRLQHFNLHEGGDTFPKIYTLAVSLIEHDSGDLPEWFNKFLDAVKDKVAEYLGTLLGAAVGSSLGPLGALFGAAIGWALGKLVGLIKSWLGDENLGVQTIMATINSYSGNWVGSGTNLSNLYTRDYRAHSGHYRIYWRCELV